MNKRFVSVIIPAHNEEAVISRCLNELTKGSTHIAPQLIVVCNGCSDNTADVVRSYGKTVTCIETKRASKTHALNLGDELALHFPRIYLDADIRLSLNDIALVVKNMDENGLLAASPSMKMDLSHSSWAVKSYYDIWRNLPYCRAGMIGVGVYFLSEAGRSRFALFPDIIADDRFVRALFTESERSGVNTAISIVTAPKLLKDLIKIKSRSRLGGYEFEKKYPELISNEQKNYRAAVWELFGQVTMWPKVMIYILVNLYTRWRANKQIATVGFSNWERDESSRT